MSNKQLTKAREVTETATAAANQGNDYSSKSTRMITSTLNRVLAHKMMESGQERL